MADKPNSNPDDVLYQLLNDNPNQPNPSSETKKSEEKKPGQVEPATHLPNGVKIIDDMGNYETRA